MEETVMDKITTEMAEHICDHICGNIDGVPTGHAEDICLECKMGKFICDILNEYNKINDFDKSQSKKMLIRIAELEEQLNGKKN